MKPKAEKYEHNVFSKHDLKKKLSKDENIITKKYGPIS